MSRRRMAALWGLIACAQLVAPNASLAQDVQDPEEQARFLLRALSFDRALESRGAVRIAVLFVGDPAEAEAMRAAFTQEGSAGIRGLPVSAVAVRFVSAASLLRIFAEEGVTAVYVPDSLAKALSPILQVTRARRLVSLAGSRALAESGLSLGIYRLDGARRIIVNLRASRVEGMDLSSDLFRLAEVIRD